MQKRLLNLRKLLKRLPVGIIFINRKIGKKKERNLMASLFQDKMFSPYPPFSFDSVSLATLSYRAFNC